jgi:ABC-type antimicrobial peptide transport system permease subunit
MTPVGLWMVMRESMALCMVGTVLGLPSAIAGVHVLRSMLFGLEPWDPTTFAYAVIGIALVALAVSFVPARRAASVDPMVALRLE